jgi:hypothetical protein
MINRRPNRGVTTPEQRAEMKWKRAMMSPEQYARWRQQIEASKARLRLEDPHGEMLAAARRNAKHRGIEFDLKETDLQPWPTHCPVLGIELHYPGRFKGDPATMVFDRINNELGYLPGNVVIVSLWVNTRKGDATPAQLRAIANFYSGFDTERGDVAPPRPIHGRCEACLEFVGADQLRLASDRTGRVGWVCDYCINLAEFVWKRSRINERFSLPPKEAVSKFIVRRAADRAKPWPP